MLFGGGNDGEIMKQGQDFPYVREIILSVKGVVLLLLGCIRGRSSECAWPS